MNAKKVKDIMIAIENYASINQNATLSDAVVAIRNSQQNLPPGMPPIRAVLAVDDNNNIVGKMGHLAFLKALEPKYGNIVDLDKLTRAGVSPEFINSMSENLRLWQEDFFSICKRAGAIKVKDVMNPVSDSIDADASLTEAIHQIILLQCLSLMVKSGSAIVGIIRLSDLYLEVEKNIIENQKIS